MGLRVELPSNCLATFCQASQSFFGWKRHLHETKRLDEDSGTSLQPGLINPLKISDQWLLINPTTNSNIILQKTKAAYTLILLPHTLRKCITFGMTHLIKNKFG